MKFSIVTISYNQAEYLSLCIDSVLRQVGPEVEYIVVDAGSTDGSRDIIRSFGRSLTYVFESDRGPADGLNKGFERANGDVFGFINADDLLSPGALQNVSKYFANKEVDVICGRGMYIDCNGNMIGRIAASKMTPWLYAYGAVTLFQQGMFFRRQAFEGCGRFNVDNKTCWDGELFLDMAVRGARFQYIRERLASFRLHAASITVSGRMAEQMEEDRQRLFEIAIGRKWNRWKDRPLALLARLVKFINDPNYIFKRGLYFKRGLPR